VPIMHLKNIVIARVISAWLPIFDALLGADF